MSDKTKNALFTLVKSCASALLVFLSSMIGNFFGGDSSVAVALGSSVATSIMLS